ncbi:MAG TPA: sensor histidine kinase [Marmoricola sp.]|nr:sensor histidine kinase [Marmoricola sp.]
MRPRKASRTPVDYHHDALVYESTGDFVDTVLPLVLEGLAAGERVLVFAPAEKLGGLRSVLGPGEVEAIEVFPFTGSRSRPAQALSSYHRLLRGRTSTDRPVRLVVEQPLAGLDDQQIASWCRIDAAFDTVCAFPSTCVTCLYDRQALPPWLLESIEQSHRRIGRFGEWRPSRQYVPSARLLARELAKTVLEPPSPPVQALPSPTSARAARRFVETAAESAGLSTADFDDFRLAIGEAVANAFKHATIDWVRLWTAGDDVVCEVRDHGPGIRDPLAGYRQPAPTATDGRGLWLVHHLCDDVKIQSGAWGTIVRLYKTARHEAVQP